MDADGDPVFLGQLVEAVEGVGVGVGREVAEAHRLAELEDLAVGVVVLREAEHAEAEHLDARPRRASSCTAARGGVVTVGMWARYDSQ